MGLYIDYTLSGILPAKNKAAHLIKEGAVLVDGDTFQPNLVCVVMNPMFDAAGLCYNTHEYLRFKQDDGRRKTWVIISDDVLNANFTPEALESYRQEH